MRSFVRMQKKAIGGGPCAALDLYHHRFGSCQNWMDAKVLEMTQQTQPQPRVIIITAKGNEDTGRIAKSKGPWPMLRNPTLLIPLKQILKGLTGGNSGQITIKLTPSFHSYILNFIFLCRHLSKISESLGRVLKHQLFID